MGELPVWGISAHWPKGKATGWKRSITGARWFAYRDAAPCRLAKCPSAATVTARDQCLEQLLEAFADIADRDDIHQAAERLARVQEWITREAEAAAADPIFAVLRLAS